VPDDETMVRRRLLRVLGIPDDTGQPVPPDSADPPGTRHDETTHRPVPALHHSRRPTRVLGWDDHTDDPGPAGDGPPTGATGDGPPEPTRASSGTPVGVTGPPTTPPPRPLAGLGAFDPGRRGVRALAVVAVLVVLGAAFWAWRARPDVEPVPGAAPPPAAGSPAGPTGARSAGPDPTELVVAVAGRVRRPGLVRLPAGSRVADAVDAAGGALPGVDVALLNPARRLTDGELLLVGATPAPAVAAPAAGAAPGEGGKVNLNTATLAQLDALPGVGPVLAQRILDQRQRRGGFRSVDDLRHVDGIGDSRFEDLKALVTV
jgi:competence protein ComEA